VRRDKRVSVSLLLVGYPSQSIQQQLAARPAGLVEVADLSMDKLIAEFPDLRAAVIRPQPLG
jgi:TRAP-type uncharacterized transport system substrate-binding protein